MKLLITGAVLSGKSTLAARFAAATPNLPVLCTNELIGKMDWSAESEEVSKWFARTDSFICEGATVVRALRKWLKANPTGKPCDQVIYLRTPLKELTKGQISSCKAQETMWREIEADLRGRGVQVDVLDKIPEDTLKAEPNP